MKLLFVGTYTSKLWYVDGTGKGIQTFQFLMDGYSEPELKEIAVTPAGENPTYLTVTHNKKFLYSTTETIEENGKVFAFRILTKGNYKY